MRSITYGVLVLIVGVLVAAGGNRKMAEDLENVDPGSSLDVVIRFTQAPAAKLTPAILDNIVKHKAALDAVQGGLCWVWAADLVELATDPDVAYIWPARLVL